MPQKSSSWGITLLIVLGLVGAFLLFPKQAFAGLAISSELGGQVSGNSGGGSGGGSGNSNSNEVSATTLGGNFAISEEISNTSVGGDNHSDEGSFTTLSEGGGGGGGGGRRRTTSTLQTNQTTCIFPYLEKYIKFGSATNDPVEVAKLQRFLRDYQGFSGVTITGIYDEPTLTAVMAFQRRYAQDVLSPWGLTTEQPTGYVFITTTLVINRLYCGYSTQHNLDLRNVYDHDGAPVAKSQGKESDGGRVTVIQPVVSSASSTIVAGDQTAALGFFDFLKDNLWYWFLPLIVLILILASYYLWREQTVKHPRNDEDEDLLLTPDQEEVRIEEEETNPEEE